MKLVFFISIFFCITLLFVFLNLGKYLDITTKVKKADIIISLGGGSLKRVKESIYLYNNFYASKKLLLLTGYDRSTKVKSENKEDDRIKYIQKKGIKNINILINQNLKNTIEEMIYVISFMKENNYKKAIIVSDPPHSRRITIILKHLLKDDDLKISLAKVTTNWWNRNTYYKNKRSLKFGIRELFKIIYTYVKFNILDILGFNKYEDSLKKYIYPIQKEIEKKLVLYLT